jgi:hypothetical protein
MRIVSAVLVGLACLLTALTGVAHHSFAAEFDIARPVTLTGAVTKIDWTNPHAWFFLDVKSAGGDVQAWAVEIVSANGLLRRGWTRETVKVGDVITIEGFGSRDGTNTANASAVIRPSSGERIWDSAPEERN